VLWFALAISAFTGVVSGLVPALQARQTNLQGGLRVNASNVFGGSHGFRISRLLVVGQIALAVVVITAAGVMLRSLARLSATDPGFRARQTVTAQVSMDRTACTQSGACSGFFQTLLDRAQGQPGVESVALVDRLPMTGSDASFVFDAEGHPRTPHQIAMQASSRTVSPSYFELMGIRLLRGRMLNASDYSGASRAAVVNSSQASQLWPGENPLGKHLENVVAEPIPAVMDSGVAYVVVGVVSDTRHESLDKDAGWETYLPLTARNEKPVMNILLRSGLPTGEIAANLRSVVAQLNPAVPVTKVRTLQSVVTSSTAAPR